MSTPHVHAELIKAWADGAVIEVLTSNGHWMRPSTPIWAPSKVYRIEPETPKPIVVVETMRYCGNLGIVFGDGPNVPLAACKVAFTIDQTTHEILSVELVKE